MAKLKKKFRQCGAPLYMSQFTMIMLILIVMCMIMSVMANKQETVGRMSGEGMGKTTKVNALGLVIGAGVFRFGSNGKARTFADNPGEKTTDEPQNPHIDLLKGEGGTGNTDANAKNMKESARFIFSRLIYPFPLKSSTITPQIEGYIHELGTGMSMFDFKVTIKCFSSETTDPEYNNRIAFERGIKIAKELNRRFSIPSENISCVVYQDRALIDKDAPPMQEKTTALARVDNSQETVFVIRVR